MTSTVKVSAHCTSDKEVVVVVYNRITEETLEQCVLQDGESVERHIYDDRAITSFERLKKRPEATA